MGPSESIGWEGAHADLISLSDDDRGRAIQVIGKPPDVTGSALVAALPVWTRWADQIASAIEMGESGAASALTKWADTAAQDEQIAASIYRPRLHADMAGQLFVRLIEVPESVPQSMALDDVLPGAFTRLSFDEAIQFFLAKKLLTPEQFLALSDAHRTAAFSATRLATDELRQRAYDALLRALQSGSTLDEFVARLRSDESELGITASSSGYLETVFRTNTQSAYGAGRLQQIQSEAVRSARPYVQYRTAGDNRVRPSHAALDRVIFRQDDPDWPRFAPPSGFNCRCAVVTLRESQVDKSKLRASSEIGADAQPDPGFNAPPS